MEIRFEENGAKAYNDEGKEVGLCEYYEKDGKWVLNHTVVDPSMKGQGIAGKLLDCVLEQRLYLNVLMWHMHLKRTLH